MAQKDEVKLHFLDYWRVIRIRWVLVVLALTLVGNALDDILNPKSGARR